MLGADGDAGVDGGAVGDAVAVAAGGDAVTVETDADKRVGRAGN